MCDFGPDSQTSKQIKLVRRFLKLKIMEDNVSFRNHADKRQHVYDMMKRTVTHGESNSALIVGPAGVGKTTLVNSVLDQLSKEVDLENDAIVVRLNGLIHTDEKTAIKSIAAQMRVCESVVERASFAWSLRSLLECLSAADARARSVLAQVDLFCHSGKAQTTLYNMRVCESVVERASFAWSLRSLLECLSAADARARSVLVLISQVDLFCHNGKAQTTLYNLFDVTHSGQAPVCVLGITNRLDVMELLEKRVKSRFSHRHIMLYPTECTMQMFVQLLSLPVKEKKRRKSSGKQSNEEPNYTIPEAVLKRCGVKDGTFDQISRSFAEEWNAHINALAQEETVIDSLEKFSYYTYNEQIFRDLLFQLVSKLGPTHPYIDASTFSSLVDNTTSPEQTVKLLHSLSILELSLVIAMKHGMDVFDGQPMNFEMVLHRYSKFANPNSSAQTVPRPVILKAFEHLQALEIIMPVRNTDSIYSGAETTASRVQKEYKLYTLAVSVEDISEAVKTFKSLPTEISHWYNNDIV